MPPPAYSRRRYRRRQKLAVLGFRTYDDYLRAPHWRQVRARYRASDQPQDCMCGETEGLHLHHLTYERLGAEALTDLTPLCPTCHAMIHVLERRGEIGLDFTGFVNEKRAERYEAERAKQAEKVRLEMKDVVDERELRRIDNEARIQANKIVKILRYARNRFGDGYALQLQSDLLCKLDEMDAAIKVYAAGGPMPAGAQLRGEPEQSPFPAASSGPQLRRI
jgi:hypothetical protein